VGRRVKKEKKRRKKKKGEEKKSLHPILIHRSLDSRLDRVPSRVERAIKGTLKRKGKKGRRVERPVRKRALVQTHFILISPFHHRGYRKNVEDYSLFPLDILDRYPVDDAGEKRRKGKEKRICTKKKREERRYTSSNKWNTTVLPP